MENLLGDICKQELAERLQSRYSLIFLRSSEEYRAIQCVINAHQSVTNGSENKNDVLVIWSYNKGFSRILFSDSGDSYDLDDIDNVDDRKSGSKNKIEQAISFLQQELEVAAEESDTQRTYILPDWSAFIEYSSHSLARQLKELVRDMEEREPTPRMNLIVIGQDWSIPAILRDYVHILDFPLPTTEELREELFNDVAKEFNLNQEAALEISKYTQGMPLIAATQVARLIKTKKLWGGNLKDAKQEILEVKKQEIRKTGILEYYEPQGQGLKDVGGLEELKTWIRKRQPLFQQNSQPKLRPRAILLEGYPGCGKSFIARAIAQEWVVPQINFEISRLQSKYLGESESNTNQALRAIEASSPNILFMDEIEKAFSGVGSESNGVMTRLFGTILSWLNDHNYPIFFIATSNDRNKLPAELFRAGRFDEIFIIMPPNSHERKDIIRLKVLEYSLPPIEDNLINELIQKTEGFSGAELEKFIKETACLCYPSIPDETHWQEALNKIKPQYRLKRMKEILHRYKDNIDSGGGISASKPDKDFWQRLIS